MTEKFISSQESTKVREFESFKEISNDPKAEGLRPRQQYAGGEPDEIIIVAGVKYKKVPAQMFFRGSGDNFFKRPYTEKEYYSHSDDYYGLVGAGWDYHVGYMHEGWGNLAIKGPKILSDLPLYNLVPLDMKDTK